MKRLVILLSVIILTILEACSGDQAGISGTGSTISHGSIDGFGSVYVNGVKFETDNAVILLDGKPGTVDDLSLGMIVSVRGNIKNDGLNGRAFTIEFNDQVQGPINVASPTLDNNTRIIKVFDLSIVVDAMSTHFDGTSFEQIAENDLVEVSGFFDSDNTLRATRVKKQGAFIEGASEIEVTGKVENLTQTTFMLGSLTVDFSATDIQDLANNINVEVKGILSGGRIVASDIENHDDDDDPNEYENVFIEGIINNFTDIKDFTIGNRKIDASSASLFPLELALKENLRIKVSGTILNGTLVAQTVELRDGQINFGAAIKSNQFDLSKALVTLDFAPGELALFINSQTAIESEDDSSREIKISEIQAGDLLRGKGFLSDGMIIATEISVIEASDPLVQQEDQFIQAPVESFINGQSITLLGLTYAIQESTAFENIDDSLSAEEFFASLKNGETLSITDKKPSNSIADEITKIAQ